MTQLCLKPHLAPVDDIEDIIHVVCLLGAMLQAAHKAQLPVSSTLTAPALLRHCFLSPGALPHVRSIARSAIACWERALIWRSHMGSEQGAAASERTAAGRACYTLPRFGFRAWGSGALSRGPNRQKAGTLRKHSMQSQAEKGCSAH